MNRLKEIRALRRVTQFQFSLNTGIHQSKLSLVEGGMMFPTEVEKQKIAEALCVTVDDIWGHLDFNEDDLNDPFFPTRSLKHLIEFMKRDKSEGAK